MIFKRKGNLTYCFDNEEEFKNYCAENTTVNIKMFSDFEISKYNKRTRRFDKVKSSKLWIILIY